MHSIDEKREQSINRSVSSIKILLLVFSAVGFFNNDFMGIYKVEKIFFTIVSFLLASVYFVDLLKHEKLVLINKKVAFQWIECFIFISIFSRLIINSGGPSSGYMIMLIIFSVLVTLEKEFIVSFVVACYSCLFVLALSYSSRKSITDVIFDDMLLALSFMIIYLVLRTIILEEKKAREKIVEISNIDCLTNVYNRKYFNEFIEREYNNSKETGESISMILLDIDHFKSVNDNYGHCFGDKVLREIAHIIKKVAGEKSTVARYGGEEFAIVLSKCSISEARILAESIRKKIEKNKFYYKETNENIKVTASLGICIYPNMANDLSDLIRKSDEALYKAKHISRNRVEIYDSIIDEIKGYLGEENLEFSIKLKSIMKSINSYDRYTLGHSERLVIYSEIFSRELKLCEDDRKFLRYSAYMHDIGKVDFYNTVLKGKNIYENHVEKGVEIIEDIKVLEKIQPIIKHHHENYGGGGFPDGLKGDNIPYFARIISIMDKFDNIIFNKNEKNHLDITSAVESLRGYKESYLDPMLCEVFIKSIKKNQRLFYSFSKNTLDVAKDL